MSDLIDRQAAIDALGYCQTYLFDSRDPDKKICREDAEYFIKQLPSVRPTLYGYDIKHLAFVASIMAKKGVSPEEAATIFRDVNRVIEMMLEDMKEMQENTLKQALKKPWEGGQDSDVQRDT